MVELGNFWHIFFILFAVGLTIGLYFLLRNKKVKTKKIFIGSILIFNLLLHFIRLLFPPYTGNPQMILENAWFINICAVSVLTFPFIFFSKSNTAKDWMFYIGIISGVLAVLYPTEALGNPVLSFDLWRFYFCHIIIFMAPLLMILLKVHKLNWHNIWKMPFCMMAVMLFIICNQVLQSELGIISMRGDNILKAGCGYRNTSLIWGPTDDISAIFTWVTLDFMKTIPFGEYAGEAKYWPFFYLLPGCFIYFIVIPFLLALIWERKHMKEDFARLKSKFKRKQKQIENTDNTTIIATIENHTQEKNE